MGGEDTTLGCCDLCVLRWIIRAGLFRPMARICLAGYRLKCESARPSNRELPLARHPPDTIFGVSHPRKSLNLFLLSRTPHCHFWYSCSDPGCIALSAQSQYSHSLRLDTYDPLVTHTLVPPDPLLAATYLTRPSPPHLIHP